ncbi:MAG: MATE family efflux transporter [Tannerella sp.]|jgi:putative MATE family efflux protein|nr:MATE family efflux transporter [Tannerella sp.]
MSQSGVKDLTQGKIYKQLIQLALPIMATGFIQMAYTLTDMAWIGRLGSRELAAIGGVGIIIWITSSMALIAKTAAEITIAQSIGNRDLNRAKKYASQTVTISALLGVGIAVLLIASAPTIVSFYKLEADVAAIAIDYLRIVGLGIPFYYLSYTFFGVYNGTGRTTIPFYLMSTGLVCNVILDPILIFGVGGFEGLGTKGAALATLSSQVSVFTLFVWKMKRPDGILDRFSYFVKLKKEYVLKIFKIGAPIALMNGFFAVINFSIARIASEYGGHLGVMSQATGSQIEGITFIASQGFSVALGTFVAQNYASGKPDRAKKAYRYILTTLLSFGIVITIAFLNWGEEIFGIFVPEPVAKAAGGEYLYVMAFCQVFMMLETATLGMWNGYGKTMPPAIISMVLNFARIPLALWLAPVMGIKGVWLSITISATLKGIVSAVYWRVAGQKGDL